MIGQKYQGLGEGRSYVTVPFFVSEYLTVKYVVSWWIMERDYYIQETSTDTQT